MVEMGMGEEDEIDGLGIEAEGRRVFLFQLAPALI